METPEGIARTRALAETIMEDNPRDTEILSVLMQWNKVREREKVTF
jgi:hypothetical protein